MGNKHGVDLPQAAGRVEVTESFVTGPKVEVAGQPAKRKSLWTPIFLIPTTDGGEMELDVRPDFLRGGVRIRGGGVDLHVGHTMPTALGVLSMLPLGLLAVGGAIGGLLGAIGWGVNRAIGTTQLPLPMRAIGILVMTAATVVTWALLAGSLSLLIAR